MDSSTSARVDSIGNTPASQSALQDLRDHELLLALLEKHGYHLDELPHVH